MQPEIAVGKQEPWKHKGVQTVGGLIIPRRVAIETIFGCNLSCVMCPIDMPAGRKKGIMAWDLFAKIISDLFPYRKNIELLDYFCLGEPLMDKMIFERIKYAKARGFQNLSISTNAMLLTPEKQDALLESGVDTVIFSIDGAKAETHEAIRVRAKFDTVVKNCVEMIERRNAGNYPTRFLVRFVRQDANRGEWEVFKAFWEEKINRERRDFIGCLDARSWGSVHFPVTRTEVIEKMACPQISEILYILCDGTVPLCCNDWNKPEYNFGNAGEQSPIEIYNSTQLAAIRRIHEDGRKCAMEICKDCTVLYALGQREFA